MSTISNGVQTATRRWNPCASIRYLVNIDLATSPQVAIMNEAIARIEQATSIDMEFVGTTSMGLDGSVPDDFGADVLLVFADPAVTPQHFPDEGYGQSIGRAYRTFRFWADGSGLWFEIFQGSVFVDVNLAADDDLRGVWGHELGHLFGLDHIGDPTEVMYPIQLGLFEFGPGDREGLWKVGAAQSCIPPSPG